MVLGTACMSTGFNYEPFFNLGRNPNSTIQENPRLKWLPTSTFIHPHLDRIVLFLFLALVLVLLALVSLFRGSSGTL